MRDNSNSLLDLSRDRQATRAALSRFLEVVHNLALNNEAINVKQIQ